MEVRSSVILHPETVQKAEKLAKETRARRRKPPKPSDPQVTRRYTKKPKSVDPRIWETALRLSGNHPRRIRVVSSSEVVVQNHE